MKIKTKKKIQVYCKQPLIRQEIRNDLNKGISKTYIREETEDTGECICLEDNKDWVYRFDDHFEGMDVWVYIDQVNDPRGISSKVMDGKKVIKQFISQEIESARKEAEANYEALLAVKELRFKKQVAKEIREKIEKKKIFGGDSEYASTHDLAYNHALDDILSILKK